MKRLVSPALGEILAGACLGLWMFGFRGLLLFMGVGLALAIVFGFVGARIPRAAAALALLLASTAFQSASTLGWGAADAPDGTRYKVSPVGLSHVLTPNQPVSATIDCGWHRMSEYLTPCTIASGGDAAFRRLQAVFPLIVMATVCCLFGAIVSLPPLRRFRNYQPQLAAGAALSAVVAVILFATSVGGALDNLQGLSVGTGGSLGTMQLTLAVMLCIGTTFVARGDSLADVDRPAGVVVDAEF
jgi:hypothetical protein